MADDDYTPPTKSYELLGKWINNGRHLVGDVVELTDEEAERLKRVIRPAKSKRSTSTPAPAPSAPATPKVGDTLTPGMPSTPA